MQTTQALAVLAQVSVAFAGFSAIVTAFGKRTSEQWRPLDPDEADAVPGGPARP